MSLPETNRRADSRVVSRFLGAVRTCPSVTLRDLGSTTITRLSNSLERNFHPGRTEGAQSSLSKAGKSRNRRRLGPSSQELTGFDLQAVVIYLVRGFESIGVHRLQCVCATRHLSLVGLDDT